jgi:general nucleoside transport system permease protein
MDFVAIGAAGVASGTILLFAAVGEVFAERSGVLNLGVEGMMFMGAVAGLGIAVASGNPYVGIVAALLAGGLLALLHGVVTIHLGADQIISGLALTFLGTGVALVLGESLSKVSPGALLPTVTVPFLSQIPLIGPIFFTNQSLFAYLGYLLAPAAWYWINRTRPGLHLRAVGENPASADTLGVNVYRLRYGYVVLGGMLAGLAGATITMAINPGWYANYTTSGAGWIAIGLVIFAQWSPLRVMVGAYLFGAINRGILDIQGPDTLLGFVNPFKANHDLTFFLGMLPYVLVIVVLVFASREAIRRRVGAPAALGIPYTRGERV